MSLGRVHNPGVVTLAGHVLAIAVLAAVLAPLMLLRFLIAPLAELLIRATDAVGDSLVERLDR